MAIMDSCSSQDLDEATLQPTEPKTLYKSL